jgi:hypothetical protein
VLAGAWNRAIFTPEWVSARLFDNVPTEFEVAFPTLAMRFHGRDADLVVQPSRIEAVPKDASDEALELASKLAQRVLHLLRETPVKAMGVNFNFEHCALTDAAASHVRALQELSDGALRIVVTKPGPDGSSLTVALAPAGGLAELNYNWELEASAERAGGQLAALDLRGLAKDATNQLQRFCGGSS